MPTIFSAYIQLTSADTYDRGYLFQTCSHYTLIVLHIYAMCYLLLGTEETNDHFFVFICII